MDKERQEHRKMKEMKKNMIGTIEEMENKIESTEVHLEDERMAIEELGMDLMEMAVVIESGSLSKGEWEKKEKKKNEVEIKKLHRMGEFQKKKEGLTALVMKKKELEREVYRIQQYLAKFRMKLKEKEKVTMVEMVISSEEDEKADVQVSIVSNIIEHYRTCSIMPKCIIYVMQLRSGEDPELRNTPKNASCRGGRAANCFNYSPTEGGGGVQAIRSSPG